MAKSWPVIDGKQVIENPTRKGHQGYHELFFHPDLMAKLKKKADKQGITIEKLVEQVVYNHIRKK